jgi:NADH-quinone oxidoreductase subunit M
MNHVLDQLLWVILVIPVIGAIVAAVLPRAEDAKLWSLFVSLIMAAIGIYILVTFPYSYDSLHPLPRFAPDDGSWLTLGGIGFSFSLGMDSISLWLVELTILLMPLAIAASFDSIKDRPRQYYAWMLALMTAMLGVFVARDLLLFYIFFELTLIPMFFIIGIWGGPERRYAAAKFFLFTFAGSVFTLAAVVYLGTKAGTFDIDIVTAFAQQHLSDTERFWIALGFLAGFSVKVPLFPVHTWLPLAHTEAPTAGSVILAGVLLKLGTYGILRLIIPIGLVVRDDFLFHNLIAFIGVLCLIGIIYGALVAWVQQDIKKLVAYSSVSHLGFCVLGLMALNDIGMQGSVLYMVNHGLSTGALFLCVGMIYDRYHTRDINELSGLARIMPRLAFFFVLFSLSSIGLPGLNGFASEFLTILGAFTSHYLGIGFASIAALGVILGAIYMLHMVARVIWGPLKVPGGHGDSHASHESHGHDANRATDINGREMAILIPLAIAVIFVGVLPNTLMRPMLDPIQRLRQPITLTTPSQTAAATGSGPAVVASASPTK